MAQLTDTKERILDAAEHLFAEHGVAATSLRSVIAKAGVNLAAVHYHFGSKDALLKAVVARRVDPANRERLDMLDRAEQASRGSPPLEAIIEAFLRPALRLGSESSTATFVKLMGRLLAEPGLMFGAIVPEHFGQVVERFIPALERALPGLTRAEILWRLHFAIGAMAHTMRLGPEISALTRGLCDGSDVETTIGRLVRFIAAGFRSPAQEVQS